MVLNDLPGAADEAADELKGLGAEVAIVEGDVGERATADAMVGRPRSRGSARSTSWSTTPG